MNMERYLQIIPILKEVVESNVIQQKYLIFADVIYELEEKLKTLDLEESIPLLDLIKEAKRLEFIQTTMTLEEFLLRPMMVRRRLSRYQDRRDRNEEQMYTRNELHWNFIINVLEFYRGCFVTKKDVELDLDINGEIFGLL